MPDLFKSIAVDNIKLSTTNPRSKLSEGNINELVESIREHGVITPVLLRPLSGDLYELVDGERRFRAAQKLELEELPAIIRELSDIEVVEIQIISSLHKKDIHPLDECHGFQQLIDIKNYSPAMIADKISKPLPYVYQRLSFQYLINPVRKAFEEGKINVGHAGLLARMQEHDQEELFAWLHIYGDQWHTVQQLKENIHNKFMTNLNQAAFSKNEEELVKGVGSCKECPKRTGFNEELFNDVSSKDVCTDRKCFEKKVQAHITRETKKIETETGEKPVKISSEHYVSGGGGKILTKSDYEVIKGKTDRTDVKKAIITHGENKGKVVQIVVKKEAEATKLQSPQSKQKSEVEKKNEEIKFQRREKANHLILDAILENISNERSPITFDDFEMKRMVYCLCDNEGDQTLVSKRRQWQKSEYLNTDEFIKLMNKKLKAGDDGELVKLMVELSWSAELEVHFYNTDNGKELRKAAVDHYGVDVAAIDKKVAEEIPFLKEEKKEKPAKKTKKKAA